MTYESTDGAVTQGQLVLDPEVAKVESFNSFHSGPGIYTCTRHFFSAIAISGCGDFVPNPQQESTVVLRVSYFHAVRGRSR